MVSVWILGTGVERKVQAWFVTHDVVWGWLICMDAWSIGRMQGIRITEPFEPHF